jgi:tetratricopeptide (TPR) repeat protein
MLRTALLVIMLGGFYSRAKAQATKEDCRDLINDGYHFLYRFMPAEALERYEAAIAMAKAIPDEPLYAAAMFGAGQAIWYRGDFFHAADTVRLALEQFRKLRDPYYTASSLRILSNIYDDQGDYEMAFKTVQEAVELYKTYNDEQNKVLSFVQMGSLYKNIGDYSAATGYYKKALAEKPDKGAYPYRELYHRLGELYAASGLMDSARYFYRKAFIGNPNSKIIRLRIGQSYLLENNTDSAFAYFDPLVKEAKITTDINILLSTALGLAKVYIARHDLPAALGMAQNALDMSAQRGARQNKRDAYQLLSAIYEAQGDAVKALQYEKLFEKIKDSVISNQFKGQLYSFKQKAEESEQMAALKDEKRVAQRTLLIICLAAGLIFVILTLRHKNEKLHLKQRASELEMQALRAQMNPHFIFNCLSAINHFILNNETDRASEYLTRFSRLLRMVLVNAGKPTIALEEELAMLRLYLNMEQLRFKDAFDYYIYSDATVQPSMVSVPSFILQPFCENAIWHGLLHKEGKGQLHIHLKMEGDVLICSIRDNGIGIEKAAAIKARSLEKGHSFGHKLSAERLALFNSKTNKDNSFTIENVKDDNGHISGTLVTLKIDTYDESGHNRR